MVDAHQRNAESVTSSAPVEPFAPGVQEALFELVAPSEEIGYRGSVACQIADITYRQLDYWARTDLVRPSVRSADGHGSTRLYSFRDILVLKIVKGLLDTGITLQNIRKAAARLNELGIDDLSSITLVSDGRSIYECRSADELVDLLAGGQGMFGIGVTSLVKELNGTITAFPGEKTSRGLSAVATPAASANPPAAASAQTDDGVLLLDELALRRAHRQQGA